MNRILTAAALMVLPLATAGCTLLPSAQPVAESVPCDINAVDEMAGMYTGSIDFMFDPTESVVTTYEDQVYGPMADVELLVNESQLDAFVQVARQTVAQAIIYDSEGVYVIVSQKTAESMIDPTLYEEISKQLGGICATNWYVTTYFYGQLPTLPCTDDSCRELGSEDA